MIDQSQSCPSCRSSKYSNPQLKLMVNVCGHSLCENCVEVLFVRGSGLCAQCKTPIRKNNFRYQLFEDPLVQKEIDIRKKLLSDFNKREDDFDCLEEYNLYLEKIEDLIYNLTNDISVEETKRYIENYKKENKEIIKKNRTKPMAFYDSELERESILREKREREEEEEGGTLKGLENTRGSDDPNGPMTTESEGERRKNNIPPTPRTNMLIPPTSAFGRRAPATFTPPSVYAPPSYIPPPTQALGHAPSSAFSVRPIVTPVSGFMAPPSMLPVAPPTGSLSNNWVSGTHHMIHLPPTASLRKQQDTVLIPSQNTSHNAKNHTSPLQFVYEPYVVELCGPMPPLSSNRHIRWIDVLQMYEKTVIVKLNHQAQTPANTSETKPKSETEGEFNDADCGRTAVDIKANYKTEESFLSDDVKKEYDSDDSNHTDIKISALKVEDSCPTTKSLGLSCQLTAGACGISPAVFLERCLLESRCGLFM
ncbi:putative cak assembly factor [Schistosoma mansoni]|uniref:putative cak assembly factor n=1 Tax=Schistosoma mansoni TaxID=6183 RepID=UPI00022DCAC1|nr:putative cak assembly factor [Schistosoma mansoni]|eukprot:XP_018654983.1 putative cak assembly factor [Schistosoma mansoni]